jgi:hypothetical protein
MLIIQRQKRYSSADNNKDSQDKYKNIPEVGAALIGAGGLTYGGINARKAIKYKNQHKNMKFITPKVDTTLDEKDLKHLTGDSLSGTRYKLSNEMLLDPRGDRFKKMREVAEKKWGDKLYDEHKGTISQSYDKPSLFDVKNNLDDNFSRERLDDYYNQSKRILKDKADYLNKEEFQEARNKFKADKSSILNKFKKSKKKATIGLGIGATTLASIPLFKKVSKKRKEN